MTTYTNSTTLLHPHLTTSHGRHHLLPPTQPTFSGDHPQPHLHRFNLSIPATVSGNHPQPHRRRSAIQATFSGEQPQTHRRKFLTTLLATSISLLGVNNLNCQPALAENWGTRSFIKERFFEPGLSPEDAVARIRQTREGLHSIRNMLETMSWRYVLFYIRLKAAYLSQDLKNAMTIVPETRKGSYVKAANELVDNMSEFDTYVRSPKVYESYLYYEKTLKSIDELVALLA